MNNIKHTKLHYKDEKIRVIDDKKIIYVYIDKYKKFKIETDINIIEYILNGEIDIENKILV